jgi:general secretion pathway protein G
MKKTFPARSHTNRRARAGYTLMEIMLVIAIIAVLVGAGIHYMAGDLDIAKEQRVTNDITSITTQLKVYEMESLFLPTTAQGLDALVHKPTTEPVPERWHQLFTKVPVDPWGMPYQYAYPGKHNTDGFDVYSLGPDRTEGDHEIGNWSN